LTDLKCLFFLGGKLIARAVYSAVYTIVIAATTTTGGEQAGKQCQCKSN